MLDGEWGGALSIKLNLYYFICRIFFPTTDDTFIQKKKRSITFREKKKLFVINLDLSNIGYLTIRIVINPYRIAQ